MSIFDVLPGGNFSPAAVAYGKALFQAQVDASRLSNQNDGLPAEKCLLLCVIAEHPGSTYESLAVFSSLSIWKVMAICRQFAKGTESWVRFERNRKKLNIVFLTKAGETRHWEIKSLR